MTYVPPNPNGQATMANSSPVVLPSNQTVAITGTVDTELPAAAALADGAANPTTPTVGAAISGFNGTTWDRVNIEGTNVDAEAVMTTGALAVENYNMLFNGTTWDRVRGDITNGLDVDVTRLPALVAGSAVVGKVGIDQTTPGTTNKVTLGSDVVHTIVDSGSMTVNAGTNLDTSALALDATLTGGTQKAITRGGAKGTTTAADITSNPIDANTQALHVDGSKVTQPVSIATMPTTPVTGTFWQATQPVSLATNTPTLQSGSTTAVTQATAANLQATATQALGSAATRWFSQISDGTNSPAVKAASTASAFTDPAFTVSIRPGELLGSTAALADATANPTERRDAADNFLFNGTSWDRQRGMSVATTTGDTGAKTATGNGATQTNVGNKGIQVVIVIGTVSGTTPTCVFKLQNSVDSGTTWVDIPGAATASLTATGNFGISVYPGQVVTAGTTTSNTTATANGILARSWRVVWTIGGTTPSFTITSITYNYIPN